MTLAKAASRLDAKTHLYARFTLPVSSGGNVYFQWSDTNVGTGASYLSGQPCYPVVKSWGTFRKEMASGGQFRNSVVSLELLANAVCVGNDNVRRKVYSLFQNEKWRDQVVEILMANQEDSDAIVVWVGYFDCIESAKYDKGKYSLTIRLVDRKRTVDTWMSDIIAPSSAPKAMRAATGQMVPRVYGPHQLLLNSTGQRNHAALLGYPACGTPGVVVDDQISNGKMRVRFAKHDGISTAIGFDLAKSGGVPTSDPSFDSAFYIYLSDTGTYALINSLDIDNPVTNDVNEASIVMLQAPRVYVPVRPSEIGNVATQVLTNVQNCVDEDPDNSAITTTAQNSFSWFIPQFPITGTLLDVRCICRWQNLSAGTRHVALGLWNTVTGNWVNAQNITDAALTGTGERILINANALGGTGFWDETTAFDTYGTAGDFKNGRLFGYDGVTKQRIPIQIRFACTDAPPNCDGVRLYDIAIVFHVRLPGSQAQEYKYLDPDLYSFERWRKKNPGWGTQAQEVWEDNRKDPFGRVTIRLGDTARPSHPEIVACYGGMADDGAGTYTAVAGGSINTPGAIAHHILAKIKGDQVNTTASLLGSFVDARASSPNKDIQVGVTFGPEQTNVEKAITDLTATYPLRVFQEDQKWQCVPYEYAPSAPRIYRSTSDVVEIDPLLHIKGLSFGETQYGEVENFFTVDHGNTPHSPDPIAWVSYINRISKEYYGQFDEIHKPMQSIMSPSIGTGATASLPALAHARFLASMSGRIHAPITVQLTQAFHDLRRGHVVGFSRRMEDVGLFCLLYRCGSFDYMLQSQLSDPDTENQAMSFAPLFAKVGTSAMYLVAQQRMAAVTFYVGTALTCTGSLVWKYYNPISNVWTAFSNVVNGDGIKSTGVQTTSWDVPGAHLWGKGFQLFNGKDVGPGHLLRAEYLNAGNTGLGNYKAGYPGIWWGRLFEVTDVARKPGLAGDYPYVDAVLEEIF